MSEVVTIGGNSYTVYGSMAGATLRLGGMLGPMADAWAAAALVTEKQEKALNQAGQLIDRQSYLSGATTFAERDAIDAFRFAAYELAAMLLINQSIYNAETSGKNIKRVGVDGGPSVSFFNPTLGISGRFPTNIQELIGSYLAGAESGELSGSWSSGTDGSQTSVAGTVTGYSNYGISGADTGSVGGE